MMIWRVSVSAVALAVAVLAGPANAQSQPPATEPQDGQTANGPDIVVTGVVTGSSAQPSIAVSVIREDQLRSLAPVSAADILRNVPGVFVNSSLGEVRNIVYSRGVSANSVEAASGYYYVSLQEDGLPVTNVTATNYTPDFFYRQDLTLGRLEALRGGTAVVTGPNAPGGIFNYISRNGQSSPGHEISARVGLLGNGRNPYYRGDAYLGGRIGQSDFYYSVGGFYRRDRGSRDPGYAFNRGGQVKASLLWDYGAGSLEVRGKYLNDRNAFYEFLPARNFGDPTIISPLSVYDSFLPPAGRHTYVPYVGASPRTYDATNLAHARSDTLGFSWKHDFGGGWSVANDFRWAHNDVTYNTGAVIFPVPATDTVLNSFLNTLGAGTYTYRNRKTGQIALQINRPAFAAPGTILVNNLPSQNVVTNGIISQVAYDIEPEAHEVINQFALTKKLETMTFRVGAYYGRSDYDQFSGTAGIGASPIENRPELFDITRTLADGTVQQVTDPNGYAGVSQRLGGTQVHARQTQFSIFGGHNWEITDRLSTDIGGRYERITVKGETRVLNPNPSSANPAFGGLDGNANTLFDNYQVSLANPLPLDYKLDFFSFTGAATYSINARTSIFARYSQGKKAPDLGFFATIDTPGEIANVKAIPQRIKQIEGGLRFRQPGFSITINPFYSQLDDVATQQLFTRADGTTYTPPPLLSSQSAYGVELESHLKLNALFSVDAAWTFQYAKSRNFGVYVANAPGEADDTISRVPDGEADNNPRIMTTTTLNVTPAKSFRSFLSWKFLGDRQANRYNTFKLPAFSLIDLGASFDVTPNLTVSANVNNLLNDKGVLSWGPSGGLLSSLDRQAFTPAQRAADPNQFFNVIATQPRAMFLSATAKF